MAAAKDFSLDAKKLSARAFLLKVLDDDLPTMSAALAYYAFLSLAPLSVGLLILGSFLSDDLVIQSVNQIRYFLGDRAADSVLSLISESRRPDLRAFAGLLTVLGILIFGSAAFSQLQASLYRIYRSRFNFNAKSWLINRLLSVLFFLTTYGLLLIAFAAFAISRAFQEKLGLHIIPLLPLVAVSILGIILMLSYRFFVRPRIPWFAAFQGAFLAALAFQLGQILFELYIARAALSSGYGAAGSLAVFLVWINFSSLIVLLGAEIAYWIKDDPAIYLRQLKQIFWKIITIRRSR